jgi:hypothetical protein
MVTRFSATEARLQAELAIQRIEEEKQKVEADRKRLADERKKQVKEQALLKTGWKAQKNLILTAAMDGKYELELAPPVYLYKDLLKSFISVVETGLVPKQMTEAEREKYAQVAYDSLKNLHSRIYLLLDKFIDNHKEHLLSHYGTLKFMKSSLKKALDESIESDSSIFDGDQNLWSSLTSPRHMARYVPELREITRTIKSYKKTMAEVKYDPYSVSDIKVSSTELVYGEYFFTDEDSDCDKLTPSQRQNKLKVVWETEPHSKFLNAGLFSGDGLTWLSSHYGQKLITALFEALKDAAEDGKEQLTLKFKLAKDGWYFSDSVDYYCCVPDELVEVIEREGYEINDTEATDKKYTITVSW